MKRKELFITAAIFFFLLLITLSITISYKPGIVADTHRYIKQAESLISNHFSPLEACRGTNYGIPLFTYVAYGYVVAIAKLLSSTYWTYLIVLFQSLSYWSVCVGIYLLVYKVSSSKPTALISSIMFVTLHDAFQWNHYVLTDSLFMTGIFWWYYCLYQGIRSRYLVLISSILIFLRPVGGVAIVFSFLAFSLYSRMVLKNKGRLAITVSILVMLIAFIIHAVIILSPDLWPFNFGSEYINLLASDYRQGVVVWTRDSTYHHHFLNTIGGILGITMHKCLAFFQIYVEDISVAHKIIALLTQTPIYILIGYGVFDFFRNRERVSEPTRKLMFTACYMVFGIVFFCAITQIDYDWRLRLPTWPLLILLSSVGTNRLIDRYQESRASYITQ